MLTFLMWSATEFLLAKLLTALVRTMVRTESDSMLYTVTQREYLGENENICKTFWTVNQGLIHARKYPKQIS